MRSGSVLKKLLDAAAVTNELVDKYNKILHMLQNISQNDLVDQSHNSTNWYVEKLKSCGNVAFMSWTREVKQGEIILKSLLRNE